ncbi:NAD(P)-dependent oxidoreductase [Thioclava sp. BHET1]|nr:NAD(P)-dependent oxidoreductase [Thioclava sp. BHET1]
MNRLLITGAAGALGRALRPRLCGLANEVRLSDLADVIDLAEHEHFVPCDLADHAAVVDLVQGCDGILHLGGISVEKSFDAILEANIRGVFNIYDAAHKAGQPRILFASSNHTIGFYPPGQTLQPDVPLRPDSLYGVSKCYGEALARMYYDKYNQETAIVRIGSCFPEPDSRRMLSTWLSYDDLASLVRRVFAVRDLGCPVIWGVSNNDGVWWDNTPSEALGWTPRDNAARFRGKVEARLPHPDPESPDTRFQGGGHAVKPVRAHD